MVHRTAIHHRYRRISSMPAILPQKGPILETRTGPGKAVG
jgi:hypothetical protein